MKYIFISYDYKHKNNQFKEIHNVIKDIDIIDNKHIKSEIDENGYFFCKNLLSSTVRVSILIPENFKDFNENITEEILNLSLAWDYSVIDAKKRKDAEDGGIYFPVGWFDMLKPETSVDFDMLRLMKWGTIDTSTGAVINGIYQTYPCTCEYCSID